MRKLNDLWKIAKKLYDKLKSKRQEIKVNIVIEKLEIIIIESEKDHRPRQG